MWATSPCGGQHYFFKDYAYYIVNYLLKYKLN